MVSHKFAIGDRVRLVTDNYAGNVPAGVYTISRKLPVEANICQYRVKHATDGHERAVNEGQLIVATGAIDDIPAASRNARALFRT